MIDKLGDACHVAADRGSHAEGGKGEGHDTRMPDPERGESGTDLTGQARPYMENWADNDIVGLNTKGYEWGLRCTVQVLSEFLDEVSGQFGTESLTSRRAKPLPAFLEEL